MGTVRQNFPEKFWYSLCAYQKLSKLGTPKILETSFLREHDFSEKNQFQKNRDTFCEKLKKSFKQTNIKYFRNTILFFLVRQQASLRIDSIFTHMMKFVRLVVLMLWSVPYLPKIEKKFVIHPLFLYTLKYFREGKNWKISWYN